MTTKLLPVPSPLHRDTTYDERASHYEGIILNLQRFSGELIADRNELARRCK